MRNNMPLWIIYALFALFFYGLWGFYPKLATMYLDYKSILLYELAGIIIAVAIVAIIVPGRFNWSGKGFLFALLTGLSGMIGTCFFLLALKHGKASIVILFTSLYPLLSLLLVLVFLKEALTLKQMIAAGLAIASLILFALS